MNIAKIKDSQYPPEIKVILLDALNTIYPSEKDLLIRRKNDKKSLVVYVDDLCSIKWVLDFTDFVHPHGIGPDLSSFKRGRETDITSLFSQAPHGNEEIIELMKHIVGTIAE